jgi:AraC-like DNA-binding protein
MLLFVSISIVLIAIIAAVYNYQESRSTIYLSSILIIFSSYSLTHYFTIYGKNPFLLAIFYGHFSPLWFLIGPLLFFYARSLFDNKQSKKIWTDSLHFLPFFLHFISISQYYIQPFSLKLEIANKVIQDLNNLHEFDLVNSLYSQNLAYFLRPSLLLAYSVYSLIYVVRKSKKQELEYYNWVLFFLISMIVISITFGSLTFIVLLSKNLKDALLLSPFHLLTGIGFLSVPVSIITIFPEIIYGKKAFKSKKRNHGTEEKAVNLSFETKENELLALKIQVYLEEHKPFLNPNFSLSDLEKGIQHDAEEIRICLKYILKKKFTELRSEYRVNYAKHLIETGTTKNTSIDGIGVLSGFSNRANFYSTFKLLAGQTPSEYLKNLNLH